MSYAIALRPAARRQLRSLSADVQRRIAPHIDGLAKDPRSPGARRMSGPDGFYRIRVGDYRVIYAVDDAEALVTVETIGHRGDVYR